MNWNQCVTCEYAQRDKHGRFLNRCSGFANCSYSQYQGKVRPWPIDQMKELLAGAVVSKFATVDQCRAFRDGVSACIAIMEEEELL